jgi:hypothetical protein
MIKRISGFAATAAAAMIITACSSAGGATTTSDTGSGTEGASDAGAVMITSPRDGAEVTEPFPLEFEAGDIGPVESGKDHVHIYAGDDTNYSVVTQESFEVTGLPEGEQTIKIVHAHANHTEFGPTSQITVNVTGGDTSSNTGGDTSDGGGGFDY